MISIESIDLTISYLLMNDVFFGGNEDIKSLKQEINYIEIPNVVNVEKYPFTNDDAIRVAYSQKVKDRMNCYSAILEFLGERRVPDKAFTKFMRLNGIDIIEEWIFPRIS